MWLHYSIAYTVLEYKDNTEKVNVWCAMSSNCIISPYFFNGTINAENYVQMLNTFSIIFMSGDLAGQP